MGRRKPIAEEILDLNELWNKTDKETITRNVEAALIKQYPECYDPSERNMRLMFFTDSGKHTIHAWFNRSRDNVKIPMIKLCLIADELEIDIKELFKN